MKLNIFQKIHFGNLKEFLQEPQKIDYISSVESMYAKIRFKRMLKNRCFETILSFALHCANEIDT